jgi:micrococcal nuclease
LLENQPHTFLCVVGLAVRALKPRSSWRVRALASAVAAICTSGAIVHGWAAGEPEPGCSGLETGPTRSVTRVVDGETVALDDGTQLRLIGALATRAIDVDADPGTWPMEAATIAALRELVLGKSIELAFGGERLDRYRRLQAHAYLVEADGRRWVQGHLLREGLARAYALPGNGACGAELLSAEGAAREAGRGLWAEAAYQVRPAHRPSELLRYRTTFQVVEGKVVRVGEARGTVYLNFGHRWRRAFAASVRRSDRQLLGAHATDPKALEGRRVRVRGWIEQRRGAPVIDLSSGGLLEIMGGGDTRPGQAR